MFDTLQTGIIPAYAGSTLSFHFFAFESQDHPRIRGEHSVDLFVAECGGGSSPHTRGAPVAGDGGVLLARIIPAYAGSTSKRASHAAARADHPRIRGEHASLWPASHHTEGSSPHTRGALAGPVAVVGDGRIIPAYAGSTPGRGSRPEARTDHPRIRGEHVGPGIPCHNGGGSSPHTRGARRIPRAYLLVLRIIPAYAGSTVCSVTPISRPRDHPRIRGEHGRCSRAGSAGRGSSPHTRGARLMGLTILHLFRIIPAYAGSTARTPPPSRWTRDHPRIRGEHAGGAQHVPGARGSSPHTRGALGDVGVGQAHCGIIPAYAGSTFGNSQRKWNAAGSSPHTRGALEHVPRLGVDRGIIPAYAGSTFSTTQQKITFRDHPRIRGEHRALNPGGVFSAGSSPHTRGALFHVLRLGAGPGIIPAYAGSTPMATVISFAPSDHPRIRGEHTPIKPPIGDEMGSSPHTRGAPPRRRDGDRRDRIIPAYAGSPMHVSPPVHRFEDHPRIRGEHVAQIPGKIVKAGSSPHTRGARRGSRRPSAGTGIIPAYAGSTSRGCPSRRRAWDHPRIRGEHLGELDGDLHTAGSSPHTRGARELGEFGRHLLRIIPAYAGSTSSPASPTPSVPDHPRIRGEHIDLRAAEDTTKGSSPHTRGARRLRPVRDRRPGIIPAYAGSTRARPRACRRTQDHPRIRGEHNKRDMRRNSSHGSSPHTRGALPTFQLRLSRLRIIPAYAGSTRPARPDWPSRTDHPRIRGEHVKNAGNNPKDAGSSPHTRGARRPRRRQ